MLNIRNQSGLALPAVIIVMAAALIFGTALWTYASAERTQVDRLEKHMQAHFLARSGAEAVAEHLLTNPSAVRHFLDHKSESEDIPLGEGYFNVTVYADDSEIIIESTGTVDGISETMSLLLTTHDDFALYATEIDGAGAAAEIFGTVFISCEEKMNADESIFQDELDYEEMKFDHEPPDGDLEEIPSITDSQTLQATGDSDGYTTDHIDIGGNSTLTIDFADQDELILEAGSFSATGNSEIVPEGQGTLRLIVSEDFDGSGTFSTEWEDSFVVIYMSDGETLEMTGTPEFHGAIYGPGATVRLGGNVVFHGMVIADELEVLGNITMQGLNMEKHLDDLDIMIYQIGQWY